MQEMISALAKEPSPAMLGMLFALAMVLLSSMRPGRPRGGAWQERMEEMRKRHQDEVDERRVFQYDMLTEMRRQSAAMEKQNELLAQLLTERTAEKPAAPAPVENTPAPSKRKTPPAPPEQVE